MENLSKPTNNDDNDDNSCQPSQPIQPPSQAQQTKEIQTQTETNVTNEIPFYMFFDKNKDQRFIKPMTKQQFYELRQQDIIRKGSNVLSANRYNRKRNLYIKIISSPIYININDRPRTIISAFVQSLRTMGI